MHYVHLASNWLKAKFDFFLQLQISFSKDSSIPEVSNAVVENKLLSEAVLESIIGKNGVSPDTKKSLAIRLSDLLKVFDNNNNKKLEADGAIAAEAPDEKQVNGVQVPVQVP